MMGQSLNPFASALPYIKQYLRISITLTRPLSPYGRSPIYWKYLLFIIKNKYLIYLPIIHDETGEAYVGIEEPASLALFVDN